MKKISLFIILIFSVFFSYKISFASNLYVQDIGDAHTLYNGNYTRQRLGNGLSGTAYSVMVVIDRNGSSIPPASLGLFFRCYSDAGYNTQTSCGSSYDQSFTTGFEIVSYLGTGLFEVRFHKDDGMIFDPNLYYLFSAVHTDGLDSMRGSITDTYVSGTCFHECDSVLDLKFAIANDLYASFIPPTPPTCFDGIQNQNETGIDTGGVCYVTTRFVNINPANGATTATTDVTISADYYLNSTTAFGDETGVSVYLDRVDIGNNGEINSFWWDTPVTYDSLTSISHMFAFNSGEIWEMQFYFTRPQPFNPYSPPNVSRFAVVNDPNTGATGYTTCGITEISGCMQNALVYLFYPSSASLRNFNALYNDYINKPPIGYIVAIQNEMKNINLSGSAVFTLQSMPILNTYIFDVLRTGLSWFFWVAFAYILFHRVKYIEL